MDDINKKLTKYDICGIQAQKSQIKIGFFSSFCLQTNIANIPKLLLYGFKARKGMAV